MKRRRLMLICALALYTALSVPAFRVCAEESIETETEPSQDFTCGGVITAIQRQWLISSIPPLVFYSNESPDNIEACVQEYRQMLGTVTAAIEENGISTDMTLDVSWSGPDVDLSSPGLYEMTGSIMAPEGYTFAEGVITQIIVPFQIKSADEVYPITTIANQNLCDGGIMIALNDVESWNEAINNLHYMATTMYGLTEDGQPACLEILSIDDTQVDLSTPGEYEIIITLAVSEENTVSFSLPKNLQEVHIPVKISDPDTFELWISKHDNDTFSFDFLKKLDSSFKLYTLESETELSLNELLTADWSVDVNGSLNTDANSMSVLRRKLTVGHYYYYQIRSDSCNSTIVMLQDNGEKCTYVSMGGNRDGSSDTSGSDDVIQPAPRPPFSVTPSQPEPSEDESEMPAQQPDGSGSDTDTDSDTPDASTDSPASEEPKQPSDEPVLSPAVPAETPSQPETSSPSEDSTPMESFTEDSDTIYGTRLDLTRKTHGGSASFSKHDIQATLSSDTLDSLDVGTDDSLTVEIKQETPSSVTLSVSKNGEPVTEIPETEITVPIDGKPYSFTVQETGTYELPEAENNNRGEERSAELPPSDPSGGRFSGSGLPIYLGLSALSLGGIFLILRRRIF